MSSLCFASGPACVLFVFFVYLLAIPAMQSTRSKAVGLPGPAPAKWYVGQGRHAPWLQVIGPCAGFPALAGLFVHCFPMLCTIVAFHGIIASGGIAFRICSTEHE